MKKFFCLILCVTSFSLCFFTIKTVKADNNYTAEIVIEADTNRILHKKNINTKKYMASTTKILTAITIIENCNLNDIVTVTKETVGVEGSSIYLEEGEEISVKDLLYGLMLRSGNDCAETLALYCSGDIKSFASLMNDTANKIGALNSNFTNPHGLHDDNHYTTAYDLAIISSYAMKNSTFREIVSKKSVNISFSTRDYDRHIVNKNKLLSSLDGATGIKTGYTKKAGRCLVSSCKRNGMELICVVLNCPDMFERSKNLINDSFNKYEKYKVIDSKNIIDFVKIENSDKTLAIHTKNDVVLPLTTNEYNNLKVVYDYPKTLQKDKINDKEIGYIKIYCENNLLFKEKIYTII